MFIEEYTITKRYERHSKLGKSHTYWRTNTVVKLRCDSCGADFDRLRGKMDPKRISNNYFHVCSNCDAKKFAQKTGITRKQIWDMPASSNLDVSKI